MGSHGINHVLPNGHGGTTHPPLVSSSRAEFERYVRSGESIDDDCIVQLYLKETFNRTSSNPLTLEMVRMRLHLMSELATQEDVIFDMEREYNENIIKDPHHSGSHGRGLFRGSGNWLESGGSKHPRRGKGDAKEKETKTWFAEAAKHNEHLFSFTSLTSRAYALQPELAGQLQERIISGHVSSATSSIPNQSQSQSLTGREAEDAIVPMPSSSVSVLPTKPAVSQSRKRPSASTSTTTTTMTLHPGTKDEKSHKRKHDELTTVDHSDGINPSASSPKAASPKAASPKAASPRAAGPKAASPNAVSIPMFKQEIDEPRPTKRRIKSTTVERDEHPRRLVHDDNSIAEHAPSQPEDPTLDFKTDETPLSELEARFATLEHPSVFDTRSSVPSEPVSPTLRRKGAKSKTPLSTTPMSTRRSLTPVVASSSPATPVVPTTSTAAAPATISSTLTPSAVPKSVVRRRRTADVHAVESVEQLAPSTPIAVAALDGGTGIPSVTAATTTGANRKGQKKVKKRV